MRLTRRSGQDLSLQPRDDPEDGYGEDRDARRDDEEEDDDAGDAVHLCVEHLVPQVVEDHEHHERYHDREPSQSGAQPGEIHVQLSFAELLLRSDHPDGPPRVERPPGDPSTGSFPPLREACAGGRCFDRPSRGLRAPFGPHRRRSPASVSRPLFAADAPADRPPTGSASGRSCREGGRAPLRPGRPAGRPDAFGCHRGGRA